MPDLTTNHGLQLWAAGELDWEHRDDMQHIERMLTIRDFDSNLANYTAYDGARFEATDTGAVYLGDGSSWNEFVQKATQDHIDDTTNPHSVTATQAAALPESGGTMSGDVDLNDANSVINTNNIEFKAQDGSGDVWQLSTDDGATRQQLTYYASGGGSTEVYWINSVGDIIAKSGSLISETGNIEAPSGYAVAGAYHHAPRGAATTSEISDGERLTYVSDGSDSHAAGDLVSARNNGGTIVSQVIAAAADDA